MSVFHYSNYIAWALSALIVIYLAFDFSKVERQRQMEHSKGKDNGKG